MDDSYFGYITKLGVQGDTLRVIQTRIFFSAKFGQDEKYIKYKKEYFYHNILFFSELADVVIIFLSLWFLVW
jgi:hypothetical protein